MKFWQNRILTGTPTVTLKDLVDKVVSQREAQVKTASTEAPVKTAEDDEAPSSGQLDVEPLHQTGDSVKPSATTKNETAAAPSPKKDEDCEADSSGQPEAEGKLVNKPEVKEEDTKEETKEAKIEEDTKEDKEAKIDEETKEDKEDTIAKTDEKVKEAAIEDIQKAKEEAEMTEEELAAKKEEEEEEKEAATTEKKTAVNKTEVKKAGFVKLANLDDKTKTWLRAYWRNLYPAEYVDAMLAEK